VGHRERFGVEPICQVLPIASSTYYATSRRPAPAHAARDAKLKSRSPGCMPSNSGSAVWRGDSLGALVLGDPGRGSACGARLAGSRCGRAWRAGLVCGWWRRGRGWGRFGCVKAAGIIAQIGV
jgi:hypothetical protein